MAPIRYHSNLADISNHPDLLCLLIQQNRSTYYLLPVSTCILDVSRPEYYLYLPVYYLCLPVFTCILPVYL